MAQPESTYDAEVEESIEESEDIIHKVLRTLVLFPIQVVTACVKAFVTSFLFAMRKNPAVFGGCFLLMMISFVPMWNACTLMMNFNYAFWIGRDTPSTMILACCTIVFLYGCVSMVFLRSSDGSVRTFEKALSGPQAQSVMTLATIFISLFGLFLVLTSLSLSSQALTTSQNLLHHCDTSTQTHGLYEYSQVLQNIRATPECAVKFSVEECEGYEDMPPYTEYLQRMEKDFRCSGFCYQTSSASFVSTEATVYTEPIRTIDAPTSKPFDAVVILDPQAEPCNTHVVKKNNSLLSVKRRVRERHTEHPSHVSLATEAKKAKINARATSKKNAHVISMKDAAHFERRDSSPRTLFSDANSHASCAGMASLDMENYAGDMANQMFFQGTYLILIAVVAGFLKLLGLCCSRKD